MVITARKQDALDEAVASLGGPEYALAVAGRSDDIDHQTETVKRAMDAFGSIDLLVNNTGINPSTGRWSNWTWTQPARSSRSTAWRRCPGCNRPTTPGWRARRSVVNISSVAGIQPAPGIGFYGATKAMLTHLTAQLAVELGPDLRVNAVAPAVVKTQFATALYEGREDEVIAAYPLKRLGVPQDIGSAVAFLLSDDAAWITGQTIVVDGGLTLTAGAE